MKALIEHPITARLGWTLLHSLWQIAAIVLAYALLRWLVRSPAGRHAGGLIALIASLVWPVTNFVRTGQVSEYRPAFAGQVSRPSKATNDPVTKTGAPREPVSRAIIERVPRTASRIVSSHLPRSVLPYAAMLWMLGVAGLSLRHVLALWSLHRLRTRGVESVPATVVQTFDQARQRLGLHRAVRLLASTRAAVPMVVGTFKPVVLLPVSVLSGLPMPQIEALIAHELAHLRRRDDLLKLLQCAIDTLLFYHPAVWWLSRRVGEDRELCCDDLATASGIDRRSLAEALGQLALSQSEPALAATGHMPVLERVRRLLAPPPARVAVNGWPWLIAITSAIVLAIAVIARADAPPRGRILDRNGVVLADSASLQERHYPLKEVAVHVLGYTGMRDRESQIRIGRAGLELSMEDKLAARENVQLTLDSGLQQAIEQSFSKRERCGAAVVMDVANGDVLALVSWPGYDANMFFPKAKEDDYAALIRDKETPLLGRAFQGAYFPASTFKLVTLLAGLKCGAIDEHTTFDSAASFEIGGRTFRNWHNDGEGELDPIGAIKRSSNTWFYQAALKIGSEPIVDTAGLLGFGKHTGIGVLLETKSFLPSDHYYDSRGGHKITPAMLASMAIGQIATVTPLQVTVATAAIANGGRVMVPRLIKSELAPEYSVDLKQHGVRAEHLELLRKAMHEAVASPDRPGHSVVVDGAAVTGATGTAQWQIFEDASKNRWLSWFTGYAVADKPRYAFSVLYEGAPGERRGDQAAATIAKEITEQLRGRNLLELGTPLNQPPAVWRAGRRLLTDAWLKAAESDAKGDNIVFYDGTKTTSVDGEEGAMRFTGDIVVVNLQGPQASTCTLMVGERISVTLSKAALRIVGPSQTERDVAVDRFAAIAKARASREARR